MHLGTLCFSILLLLASGKTAAQEREKPVALRIPNGWTELPDWMAPGLPFDADVYYGISEAHNREVPYLRAFLEINFTDVCDVIPGVEKMADFEARYSAARRRSTALHELWDRHVEYSDDRGKQISIRAEGIGPLETALREYYEGIELLRAAQQRENCFFHIEVDTAAVNSVHLLPRQVARILGCCCLINPAHDRAVDDVRTILRLKRDLQKLGKHVAQLSLYSSEEICFDWMVSTLLEHPGLRRDQVDELVEVLSEHHRENQEIDPAIEAARYEYMMLSNLLRQLETGAYDASQRSRNWDLKRTLSDPAMVIHELTSSMDYEINASELRSEITRFAEEVPEIADLLEQYNNIRNELSASDGTALQDVERQRAELKIDSQVLLPVLLNRLMSMTRDNYENESTMLRIRCRQITEACQSGFPESTRQLQILGERWTTDNEWKDLRILRWFKPGYSLSRVRIKSTLQTNAFLCLAAIRKWQMENSGSTPSNLDDVMSAAGIDTVPMDPFSGEPLKMAVIDNEAVIYSLGPDGDDDHARIHYDIFDPSVWRNDEDNGDVVFRFETRKPMGPQK